MASTTISTRYNAEAFEAFQESHWTSYSEAVNGCCDGLSEVWRDLGFQASEIGTELETIAQSVICVWQAALKEADAQKVTFRKRIDDVESDIRSIQEQLGHLAEDMITPYAPGITLKERLDEVQDIKNKILDIKQERITEFKNTMSEMNAIQTQFGQEITGEIDFNSADCTITKADLDNLRCELESLCAERTRRMMRLDKIWRPLKNICREMDEDPVKIASTVHPTFKFIEESFSGMAMSFSFEKCPSLSEPTFAALEQKVSDMTEERSKREAEMQHLKENLFNLWEALQTASNDFDRSILTRLMEGPARLHRKTFDKVTEEINRQETAKARILRDLVGKKFDEIQTVCGSGHLPLPQEAEELMADIRSSDVQNPGHYADALACLTRILTETTVLSETRSEILTAIHDLQSARSEVQWLVNYETDGTRYKGRDVNRKLQRAIKAGRVREKLPSMVDRIRTMLLEWEETEHQPFVFDGKDYRADVLEVEDLTVVSPVKLTRNGRNTPSGKRSTVSQHPVPSSEKARGTVKNRPRPASRVAAAPTKDPTSKIARPQSSFEFTQQQSDDYSHLYKNAHTDYHPLQERLDKLMGSEKKKGSSANFSGAGKKRSGIPMVPIERGSLSETMSIKSVHCRSAKARNSSEDDDILNSATTAISENAGKSLPLPLD